MLDAQVSQWLSARNQLVMVVVVKICGLMLDAQVSLLLSVGNQLVMVVVVVVL